MKKLLSALTVAALVTSAFAFTDTNKALTYCVRNAGGNACVIIRDKLEFTIGTDFLHFPLGSGKWNGTLAGCTNASPVTDCIVTIRLHDN